MKVTRALAAGLCLSAGAVLQFWLAFSGNSASRILCGGLFAGAAFIAWSEWNRERAVTALTWRKHGRTAEERDGSHF